MTNTVKKEVMIDDFIFQLLIGETEKTNNITMTLTHVEDKSITFINKNNYEKDSEDNHMVQIYDDMNRFLEKHIS